MSRRALGVIMTLVAVAGVAVVTVALAGGSSDPSIDAEVTKDRPPPVSSMSGSIPPSSPATSAAREDLEAMTDLESAAYTASVRFLDDYVDGGRVVRTDEGGDTVSEGQAYAMLIALAVGDDARFGEIWEWTAANLRRPDGLLAWRWEDGEVVDEAAASDADVLAAWALLLGADRFDEPDYRVAGEDLAEAVLERETVMAGGLPVLVAGPWARHSTPSFVVPGYFAPPVFSSLADLTGDDRWEALTATARDVTDQLVSEEAPLVPDWAQVDGEGRAVDHGGPGSGGAPGAYGLDAARLYVWLAISCVEDDRALATPAWSLFEQEAEWGIAMAYDTGGSRLTDNQHPLTWVAAASTGRAAGSDAVERLLDEAGRLDEEYPSYYGSAWVALGRVLLTTDWLHTC